MISYRFADLAFSIMDQRIYNFSSGPAMLPIEVLEQARDEMLSYRDSGMSVMEMSHRSAQFEAILDAAERGIRALLDVPSNYRILFLQGGARLQFSMIPINFLAPRESADYVVTGAWGKMAAKEAAKCGNANIIFSSEAKGFRTLPEQAELTLSDNARYLHYVSNETIDGVEFKYDVDGYGVPVICDASSNILSKPLDVEKYAIIYAGAQKNIGPSGVTLVIIRDDMLDRVPTGQHSMLDYRAIAENGSMLNTPNTWGIYIISLVCEWLEKQGGLTAMAAKNGEKAAVLYNTIDNSDGFYTGHAAQSARSLMNVTFRLPSVELETQFCTEAARLGLDGLKGHRSVGGIRASIYNAFPREGVERLVELMVDFANRT